LKLLPFYIIKWQGIYLCGRAADAVWRFPLSRSSTSGFGDPRSTVETTTLL